ncbi:MAG: hypothetical protein AB7J35_06965 [Dehalococcoidia bacterium]
MKLLLFGLVVFLVITVIMAVVFRDQRSRARLRFMLKLGWAYVIAVVLLAAWRAFGGGF